MDSVSIRFGNVPGIVAPLEVEAPEGSYSLEDLRAVLFAMRVQVVRVAEEYVHGRFVRHFGVCEFHGGPLTHRRRRAIASQIAAVLPPSHESRPLSRAVAQTDTGAQRAA